MTQPTARAVAFNDLRAAHAEVRAELDACWADALEHASFIGGAAVEQFERSFADACGIDNAVGVGNGTDALQLVLEALGIGRGSEVIVPANTFIATAEAVARTGAQPVFVDVSPDSLLISPDAVRAALSARTAAVIAVHLYGQLADMAALQRLCRHAGVALIEDAAQAHGARRDGLGPGARSAAATFSFYPGKNLGALGDGGAVLTGDRGLADAVRMLANHGRGGHDGDHAVIGTNSRLDALQAAVLSVKLRRLDTWNERRRQVHAWYRELLPAGARATAIEAGNVAVHHLEVARVPRRDEVRGRMLAAGIATGVHYPVPCHRTGAFRRPGADGASCPVAEDAAARVLSLPMHPFLTRDDVALTCDALAAALEPAVRP
ncbi:MAG: DegT/DnrJ/EryC1/StrS family aminotransferase [Vicinamibacterales bacterium]